MENFTTIGEQINYCSYFNLRDWDQIIKEEGNVKTGTHYLKKNTGLSSQMPTPQKKTVPPFNFIFHLESERILYYFIILQILK